MMFSLVSPYVDRGVLGEDRDAALALLVHGVHDAIGHRRALPESARLTQHGVDERRLAMVDVGDDGDVAEIVAGRGEGWVHGWHAPQEARGWRKEDPPALGRPQARVATLTSIQSLLRKSDLNFVA